MDIYIKLFEVLFPVFFVVGIGYYLGKKKYFKLFNELKITKYIIDTSLGNSSKLY